MYLPLLLATTVTAAPPVTPVTPFQMQLYLGGTLLAQGKNGCLHVRMAAVMARAGNGPSGEMAGMDRNLLRDLSARCGIR